MIEKYYVFWDEIDRHIYNLASSIAKRLKDTDIKNLNNEIERLKHDIMNLKMVENKYKQISDENDDLRQTSDNYDNLKREYDLLMSKFQKKNIIETTFLNFY